MDAPHTTLPSPHHSICMGLLILNKLIFVLFPRRSLTPPLLNPSSTLKNTEWKSHKPSFSESLIFKIDALIVTLQIKTNLTKS